MSFLLSPRATAHLAVGAGEATRRRAEAAASSPAHGWMSRSQVELGLARLQDNGPRWGCRDPDGEVLSGRGGSAVGDAKVSFSASFSHFAPDLYHSLFLPIYAILCKCCGSFLIFLNKPASPAGGGNWASETSGGRNRAWPHALARHLLHHYFQLKKTKTSC